MNSFEKFLTVTEAKKRFLDIVESIEMGHDMYTLTRNGKPTTIMMNLEDYESLIETIEILADPEIMKILKISEKQRKQGKLIDAQDVWE